MIFRIHFTDGSTLDVDAETPDQKEIAALRAELDAALKAHDQRAREPWTGPNHFREENDRIGALIDIVDTLLMVAGRWPEGKGYIGNEERLLLLGEWR